MPGGLSFKNYTIPLAVEKSHAARSRVPIMKTLLSVFAPLTPMRGLHVNAPFRFSLEPSAKNTAARKNESVGSVIIDDGQFKVALEWCGRDRLPLAPVGRAAAGGGVSLRLSIENSHQNFATNNHPDAIIWAQHYVFPQDIRQQKRGRAIYFRT